MRVAGIQTAIEWGEPERNFERFSSHVGDAVAQGADLVVLPETFATGFGFGTDGFPVEPFGGPSATFLSAQARRHRTWMTGSCPERGEDGGALPYNSLVFASPDGDTFRYRKIHPFTFAEEDRYVRPGTELVSLSIRGARVTPFVCYDLRFAPEFWAAGPSTDVFVVVANWPAARREHWVSLLRARAIENLAYVVGVNRIGEGNGLAYSGDSMVIAPDGEVIADAGSREVTIAADIDPDRVRSVRERFGFLNDRHFRAERSIQFDD